MNAERIAEPLADLTLSGAVTLRRGPVGDVQVDLQPLTWAATILFERLVAEVCALSESYREGVIDDLRTFLAAVDA